EQTNYDFNVVASQSPDGMLIVLRYNTASFSSTAVQRIRQHLKNIISAFAENTDILLPEIEVLSEEERQQLLTGYSESPVEYSSITVMDMISRQATLTPDNIALIDKDVTCSYRELDEQSNQMAAYLFKRGIGEGSIVPVCLDRSIKMMISILGILKTGAAYVPVDPVYPKERKSYMLSDVNAELVITQTEYGDTLGELSINKINVETEWPVILQQNNQAITCRISADSIAYIIYTSGSTGDPKGVMITHANLHNFINWCHEEFKNDSFEIVYAVTSVCFDLSIYELFYPLTIGKKIRLLENSLSIPEYLPRDTNVLLNVVPGIIKTLLQSDVDLSTVCAINMAGEPIPLDVKDNLDLENITVRNLYGPTEATTYSSVFNLQKELPVLIGKPIANTTFYILDKNRKLLPQGLAGELYIGGAQLAKGYWNREQLTKERFVISPFNKSEHLYRTGDLVRWFDGINLEYLGRLDDQVKIRGYRIEPGEIEHALQKVNGINAAIVKVWEDTGAQKMLVAYVITKTGTDEKYIRQCLSEKLPDHMIPARILFMESFPLTANGKINKKALPAPDSDQSVEIKYIAPRNHIEEALAETYGNVLLKNQVSVQESFFDLGGESIKAILLVNRLKQKGYTVRIGDILKYPVIEQLAEHITTITRLSEQQVVQGEVILTPVQRWFLDGPAKNKHHNNQSLLLSSKQTIDEQNLRECLRALVNHHDTLRMVYYRQDGQWRQYNRGIDDMGYYLEVHDLKEEKEPQLLMENLCNALQQSIDLQTGPLFRAALFHLNDGDRLLMLGHHLVIDSVSWRILLEDLTTAYNQHQNGEVIQLPLKSDSFQLWADRLYKYANS
ncbi:MAG: amino acid adenylation domain-containing protein, partial [Chitinophagaceae bacterium]